MDSMIVVVLVLVVLIGLAAFGKRWFEALPKKKKKKLFTKTVNDVFTWFEDKGLMKRTPAFDHNYHRDYPALRILEAGYADVREECLKLLDMKDRLTDVRALGAGYTEGGIHTAKWKAFMFKSGEFIDENCARAPKTAALLKRIPGLYTAFFSVLDPHQDITPHWGYYKGFLRYHLGVIIPENNANGKCWIRVNGDAADNAQRDKDLVTRGEIYHWKNGEGIIFDDNYLHAAANESDEVRVILWLDMRRAMPFYVQWFNRLCLWLVYHDNSVEKIRRGALIS
ncbi:MAG: aspartyl/asparaginyl beta-hydroxylase domain-containing protein [Gammaproteobacteria bacterium]|nr:aspartyl/asparaginyl beta-hydroxylase domain-containing protein [Gammaproteobacteria bacterium]